MAARLSRFLRLCQDRRQQGVEGLGVVHVGGVTGIGDYRVTALRLPPANPLAP